MNRRTCLLFWFLSALGVLSGKGIIGDTGASESGPSGPERITVPMEACQATRPGAVKSLFEALAGAAKENLVKQGVVEVDGRKYTLYLPKAKAYSVRNTEKKDHIFANTSTRLAVDQKGDGKLTEADNWFANLPVRLGDRMYDVVEIAADGSRLVLKASKSPLCGVIVGRSCPPFSIKTADGKTISRDSLAGNTFLLDIWSVT
jgi:hypothetical protein